MLGITDSRVVMKLRKPIYGLVDAPRAWYKEAAERLERLGFTRHPLDQCLFLWHDRQDLDSSGRPRLICGLIGDASDPRYISLRSSLQKAFSFREWHEHEPRVEYLGAEIETDPDGNLKHHQSKYLAKLHPITIPNDRLSDPSAPVTEKERTGLRALLGGLQWVATQSSPHVQPHTSMLAGMTTRATVATLQAANKALRFAKQNADVGLCYGPLGSLDDLVVVAYSDASFACRDDLSSQGGYLVTLCHKDAVEKGVVHTYHVLDWRSFKLQRVARSTLSAEGQAAAEASDAIYFTSLFLRSFLDPSLDLSSPTAARLQHPSALVVDAKALFDLLHQDELQARLGAEKRTAVEVLVTKQKLVECGAAPRWVSSERQLADGLTKESATQLLADRLRTHKNRLVDDQTYQAARRKDLARRIASANEFAIPRPQALATAMFACCVSAAQAQPLEPSHPIDFVDFSVMVFTALFGLLLVKLLLTPWTFGSHLQRTVYRDQEVQTDHPGLSVDAATQTSSVDVCDEVVQVCSLPSVHQEAQTLNVTCSRASQVSPATHQGTATDPAPTVTGVSPVVYRRDQLPSSSSQVSEATASHAQRTIGTMTALRVEPVRAAVASFFIQNPGEPAHSRGVPYEHRCPEDLRVYVTNAGDTWHCSHSCADSRTRNPTRSFRPCRICTTGHSFPVLREHSLGR